MLKFVKAQIQYYITEKNRMWYAQLNVYLAIRNEHAAMSNGNNYNSSMCSNYMNKLCVLGNHSLLNKSCHQSEAIKKTL
jgi:hypothetical protein